MRIIEKNTKSDHLLLLSRVSPAFRDIIKKMGIKRGMTSKTIQEKDK